MMSLNPLSDYFQALQRQFTTGQAGEHTYRPALKTLLESIETGLIAINEPRRIAVGAPDFILQRGNVPIGFVEAKDLDADLNRVERSEQVKRYRDALGNLILTNYLEFRWYVQGEHRWTATLGTLDRGRLRHSRDGEREVAALLRQFAAQVAPTIGSPRELAERMAAITREIRNLIQATLASEERGEELHQQMAAFRETLLHELTESQFADIYAQTLAYGLFAARVRWAGRGAFDRREAAWSLPPTNPFLRDLFNHIAGPALDERVAWLVDSLAHLLACADTDAILRDFGRATRTEDPIVHFYETFLAVYDPNLRERCGVYYTPEPVVSYIVRSVDALLRERFGRPDGLTDANTLILDPATGTGTFLYFVTQLIHERLGEQGQLGAWDEYVSTRLLPRVFGFELLMAPYAVAHMKLGIQLQETGYRFSGDQRLGVYLTNTLEEAVQASETLGFAGFISREANDAAAVKRDKPIMVVLGNPPYSGHSANKGEWIGDLVREYYFVDGQPLGERNPKWLQDDYVKFIRFGQWRIERTGEGVLAFVTNHGYLDNPTFRGMRQQLMQAFSEIYVLNLHGNAKKRETAPDGGPDENVFDIQQGVAIGIFVKRRGVDGPARVFHADLWSVRESKYAALWESDVLHTTWAELKPDAPFYLFVPQDVDLRGEYQQFHKITEILPANNMGITTGNDARFVAFSDAEFRARGLDVGNSTTVAYRPFDNRRLLYQPELLARARYEFMHHLRRVANLALVTLRRPRNDRLGNFFMTEMMTDKCIISSLDNAHVFPLYLYPDPTALLGGAPWPSGPGGRTPNLDPAFVGELESRLGLGFVPDGRGDLQATFGPEDVLSYIYAVFHSPTYRERYAEFLRIDFPCVPLTDDPDLFAALVEKGTALIDLHLMRSPALNTLVTAYPVPGEHLVERGYPRYVEQEQRVYINSTQYFEGVEPNVWTFQIGGYQVLDKWLKDRRGRRLSWDDVQHYQRVVVALRETIHLMDEIDALIPAWPIK